MSFVLDDSTKYDVAFYYDSSSNLIGEIWYERDEDRLEDASDIEDWPASSAAFTTAGGVLVRPSDLTLTVDTTKTKLFLAEVYGYVALVGS